LISNIDGSPVMSVSTMAEPNNILNVQAGAGQQAAGLYVQEGQNGSANLGLYPAAGGEIQMTSPISAVGGALPATAGGGFLHININGTDYRIPLLSASQAGG
jgi:hypothetical protein